MSSEKFKMCISLLCSFSVYSTVSHLLNNPNLESGMLYMYHLVGKELKGGDLQRVKYGNSNKSARERNVPRSHHLNKLPWEFLLEKIIQGFSHFGRILIRQAFDKVSFGPICMVM